MALNAERPFDETAPVAPGEPADLRPFAVVGGYRLRFAKSAEDLEAIFRLRFLVFNLELGEGLQSSYRDGQDIDDFDSICDHLIVEHGSSGQVVGTYRLQTGQVAARNQGYYSALEFDFSPYEAIRDSLVELGRACIHRRHRSFEVLSLLWRGIAQYALERKARYLIGCSSLTSQCLLEGSDMYWRLQEFLAEPALRTNPWPKFSIPIEARSPRLGQINPPRLLRAYLSIGAQICGAPAIDREFGTIDFLTLLDLERLSASARSRFLRNI
ncbi:MAG TPA: GNAT family N-acyltransferase [Candidatus Bathyarchaeia archaeon]|jgi:putative hemolysin|nr:GNAT family N-acyltransferase [Candidatus Bathyarchaeia archaeon]